MSIKPILFNTEMVRAILDGRKTVTRRGIKDNVSLNDWKFYELHDNIDGALTCGKGKLCAGFYTDEHIFYIDGERHVDAHYYTAPYRPGDILYVRETWRVGAWDIEKQAIAFDYADGTCRREWIHIADREKFDKYVQQSESDARKAGLDKPKWEAGKAPTRWRPSIHMPKEAARIWLKVTDVRVERLKEVTEEQAAKEGAIDNRGFIHSPDNEYDEIHTAREHFKKIWDSTIQKQDLNKYGWDANPWVWVIEFERCEKPEEGSR